MNSNAILVAKPGIYRVDVHITADESPRCGTYQVNLLANGQYVPGGVLYTAASASLSGSFIACTAPGTCITFRYCGTAPLKTDTNCGCPSAPTISVLLTNRVPVCTS
jgi:hypothetical protein